MLVGDEEQNEVAKLTLEQIWGEEDKAPSSDNVSDLLRSLANNGLNNTAEEIGKLREAAKIYLDADISVIPVGGDKKPLIPWKIYQGKRATLDEVERWLEIYPKMQLGIVTGLISKLLVVDVEAGGDPSWLPETAIAKTGGGGWHYYYSYVEGVNNKARIKDKIDIRGEGGYVIAPPSKSNKGSYEWLKQVNPVPFPKALFELNKTATTGILNAATPILDSEYQGYAEGQRNDEMTRYIGKVLKWIHPSDWDTVAWMNVLNANQKNRPPLTESELRLTFGSIRAAEKRSQVVERIQKPQAATSELWRDENDEVLPLEEVARRQGISTDDKIEIGIRLFDDATKGGMNFGDLVILSAPTGMGKTSFAQFMTANLSAAAFPVLWFSYEVLPKYLWEKFEEMGINSDNFLAYIPLKHVTGMVEWIEQKILEAKKKFWVKAVVIDHLGFLVPRRVEKKMENYSAYLGQICRDLKAVAIREEIIIILPVHMRKTDEPEINDIAFSAGIAQEADLVFTIAREKDFRDDSDQEYTSHTRIALSKNRKTGMTVKGWFLFENNKFVHDVTYVGLKNESRRTKKKYEQRFRRDTSEDL